MKKLNLFILFLCLISFNQPLFSSGKPEFGESQDPCTNGDCDPPDPSQDSPVCNGCLELGFVPVPFAGGSFDKGRYIFYLGDSSKPSSIQSGSIVSSVSQQFRSKPGTFFNQESAVELNKAVGPYQVLTFGHWALGIGGGATIGSEELGTGLKISMQLSGGKTYEASRIVNTYEEAKKVKTFTTIPNTAKKFEQLPNKTTIMTAVKGQVNFMLGAIAGYVASAGVDTDIPFTHWLLRMEKPDSTTAILSFTHVKTEVMIGAKATLGLSSVGVRKQTNAGKEWRRKLPNLNLIKRKIKGHPTKASDIDSHPGDRTVYVFKVDLRNKDGRDAYDRIFKGNFYEAQALARKGKGIDLIDQKNKDYKRLMSKVSSLERTVQNTKVSTTVNRGSHFVPIFYNRRNSRDVEIMTEDLEFLSPNFNKSFGKDLPEGTILHTLRGSTQSKKTSGGILSNHFNRTKKFHVKWENLEIPAVTSSGLDRSSLRRVIFEYSYTFMGEEWTASKFEEELQKMSKKIGYKEKLQSTIINPLGGTKKSVVNIELDGSHSITHDNMKNLASISNNLNEEQAVLKKGEELVGQWIIKTRNYREACPILLSRNPQKCKKHLIEKTKMGIAGGFKHLRNIHKILSTNSNPAIAKKALQKEYGHFRNFYSENKFTVMAFTSTNKMDVKKANRIDTVRFQADLSMDEDSIEELAKKSIGGLEANLNKEALELINKWFTDYPEDYDEVCPGHVGLINRAKKCKEKIISKTKKYFNSAVNHLKEINKMHRFEGRGNELKNEDLMKLYLKFGREFSKSQFTVGAFVDILKGIKSGSKGNFLFCVSYMSSITKPSTIVLEPARRRDRFVCTLPEEKDISNVSNIRDSDFFDEGARIDMSKELNF